MLQHLFEVIGLTPSGLDPRLRNLIVRHLPPSLQRRGRVGEHRLELRDALGPRAERDLGTAPLLGKGRPEIEGVGIARGHDVVHHGSNRPALFVLRPEVPHDLEFVIREPTNEPRKLFASPLVFVHQSSHRALPILFPRLRERLFNERQ